MIVPIASEAHHRAHLDPILAHLPHSAKRTGRDDAALVASYGSMRVARRKGFRKIVLAQHGAGQSYGVAHPSYPGGQDNADVGLFLCPNEHSAERWRKAYPRAAVEVVGCPKLDTLPARGEGSLTIATSFHWKGQFVPEAGSAFDWFGEAVVALSKVYKVIGHGHPLRLDLPRWYRKRGIEHVASFDKVCQRADLYICDNSSTLFEFAATGRPVVVLNSPKYRRKVDYGLRFWEAADIGIQVSDPAKLRVAVEEALTDPPARVRAREAALDIVYAHRDGSAGKRAATAVLAWLGADQTVAA